MMVKVTVLPYSKSQARGKHLLLLTVQGSETPGCATANPLLERWDVGAEGTLKINEEGTGPLSFRGLSEVTQGGARTRTQVCLVSGERSRAP